MIRKPSTIDDVAREARVSAATVSRALRGHPNVAPSTRARVEQAARLLHYRPDPSASRLARGRSSTVAMVVPVLDSWYFSAVMAGAEAVLTTGGYELAMIVTGDEEGRNRLRTSSVIRGAEGLILVDVAIAGDEVATLLDHGEPAVSIGLDLEGISSVMVDDIAIGREATTHLLDLGHREIALISGTADDPFGFAVPERRRQGYRQALDGAAVTRRPDLEVNGNFSVSGGYEAMCQLLEGESPPTAVFSMSDEMAFGALKAIRDCGLSVPTDISVVGVDDHPLAWVMDLTTVQQQVGDHGAMAAQVVLDQIEQRGKPVRVEAETSLVSRGSTARPR